MLEINNLTSGYGKTRILHNVDINVKEGEFTALLGANGVGKTTLLMTVSGIIQPMEGTIKYMGINITNMPVYKIIELGLAHVPQEKLLFLDMTILENLEIGSWGSIIKYKGKEFDNQLNEIFGYFEILRLRKNKKASTLSGGEQQMLAIARALMAKPKMLLIDEPSSGLSPIMIHQVAMILDRINKAGVTILLVEQNIFLALELASRGYIIERGTITQTGTSEELLSDDRIRKSYLGT